MAWKLQSRIPLYPWIHIRIPEMVKQRGDNPDRAYRIRNQVIDVATLDKSAPGMLQLGDTVDTPMELSDSIPGTIQVSRYFTLEGDLTDSNTLNCAFNIPRLIYGSGVNKIKLLGRAAFGAPAESQWIQVLQPATQRSSALTDNGFAFRAGFMTDRYFLLSWIVDHIEYTLDNGSRYSWNVMGSSIAVPIGVEMAQDDNRRHGSVYCGAGSSIQDCFTLTRARDKQYADVLLTSLTWRPKEFLENIDPSMIESNIPLACILGAEWDCDRTRVARTHSHPDLAWRAIRRKSDFGTLLGKGGAVQARAKDSATKVILRDVGVTRAGKYRLRMKPEAVADYGNTLRLEAGEKVVIVAAQFLHEYYEWCRYEKKVAIAHDIPVESLAYVPKTVAVTWEFV